MKSKQKIPAEEKNEKPICAVCGSLVKGNVKPNQAYEIYKNCQTCKRIKYELPIFIFLSNALVVILMLYLNKFSVYLLIGLSLSLWGSFFLISGIAGVIIASNIWGIGVLRKELPKYNLRLILGLIMIIFGIIFSIITK
ncbi:MAG: hypothetical protein WC928_04200 [Patescibacteria group bacterium]